MDHLGCVLPSRCISMAGIACQAVPEVSSSMSRGDYSYETGSLCTTGKSSEESNRRRCRTPPNLSHEATSGQRVARLFLPKTSAVTSFFQVSSAILPIPCELPSHSLTLDESEVEIYLRRLKRKPLGPDGLLRHSASALSPFVTYIFNASLREGIVLAFFKASNISPIPKCSRSTNPTDSSKFFTPDFI